MEREGRRVKIDRYGDGSQTLHQGQDFLPPHSPTLEAVVTSGEGVVGVLYSPKYEVTDSPPKVIFHLSPKPTSLNQYPNLNPTSLITTQSPRAGEPS